MTLLTPGVSFHGQTQAQIKRLGQLNTTLADLQRQMTTQKKFTNFSAFRTESLNVQRVRLDNTMVKTYLENVTTVSSRVTLMSDTTTRISQSGRDLMTNINTHLRGEYVDTDLIQQIARDNVTYLKDLMNIDLDGRHLFSGSMTDVPPLSNTGIDNGHNAVQALFADWQSGAITTAQMISAMETMTPAELGFDPQLAAAGTVSARIGDSFDLDYTSVADRNGFQDIFKAMVFLTHIEAPDPQNAPPGPTDADFHDLLNSIANLTSSGIAAADKTSGELSSKFIFIKAAEQNHTTDAALYEKTIAEKENVDMNEVVAKIQVLQTQLTASYEVTSLVSQLSLVNFI